MMYWAIPIYNICNASHFDWNDLNDLNYFAADYVTNNSKCQEILTSIFYFRRRRRDRERVGVR